MNLSRQDVLTAQGLGTEAGRILSRGGLAGKILAALAGGIYFLTDDQEVFWVCPDPAPMHRRCVRTAFLPMPRRVWAGQRFCTRPMLIVGDSFAVDLRRAKEWNPHSLPGQALPPASVKEKCGQLIRFFRCLDSRAGLSPAIPGLWTSNEEGFGPSRAVDIFSRIFPVIFKVSKACRQRDLAGALEKGKELIGWGPGLTPSGDDFMGGLLFSAFFLKEFYPEVFFWDRARVTGFLAGAQSRTHPISHVLLSDFASGHAPAPLGEVLAYLLQGGDFEKAASAAVQLLRFGHSSGGDMLAGLMTGMLLISGEPAKA
jgi:Protein of unknown function (DUF2877)